jgi:hypothetical protein
MDSNPTEAGGVNVLTVCKYNGFQAVDCGVRLRDGEQLSIAIRRFESHKHVGRQFGFATGERAKLIDLLPDVER